MKLWIAQGFGVGRVPFAPGTLGSLVGLAWFVLLLATAHVWMLVAGTVIGLCLSVWLCGAAEKKLVQKDPGSVVLDEISAMPVCFVSWMVLFFLRNGTLPSPHYLISKHNWFLTLGVFVGFRLFDIWKPWPVRQSQRLPGGWGITIDDVLAAIYVAIIVLLIQIWRT